MEALLERANKIKIPTTEVVQRLHPDWRMVPHLEIFGWTEKHQQLEEYLQNQVNTYEIIKFLFLSVRKSK